LLFLIFLKYYYRLLNSGNAVERKMLFCHHVLQFTICCDFRQSSKRKQHTYFMGNKFLKCHFGEIMLIKLTFLPNISNTKKSCFLVPLCHFQVWCLFEVWCIFTFQIPSHWGKTLVIFSKELYSILVRTWRSIDYNFRTPSIPSLSLS
jgi:hypothetical protein